MGSWSLSAGLLATRVSVEDIDGLFSKGLIIEPGLKAMIIEEGRTIGQVPPGSYTLQTFSEKLKFWKQKQCDAILAHEEEQVLTVTSDKVLTADFLQVDVSVQLSVGISDLAVFQRNVMGNRSSYSMEDFRRFLQPQLAQFVSVFISGRDLMDLRAPDTTQQLDAWLADQLTLAMQRLGLVFGRVHTLQVVHPEFDEELQRRGEVVLLKMAQDGDRSRQELADQAAWDQVNKKSRELEIARAVADLEADQRDSEREQLLRRVGVRAALRKAVQMDRFNKLSTRQEREDFLRDADRHKLLRDDEFQVLQDALEQQQEDRDAARKQFLARLQLNQKHELQLLADEYAHQLKVRSRNAELELARIDEDEQDRLWRKGIEREAEEAEIHRTERWKKWEDRVRRFQSYWSEKRDDEIRELAHEDEKDRLTGEIELRQQERTNRLALLQQEQQEREFRAQLDRQRLIEDQRLAVKKQQQEAERENARKQRELENAQRKAIQELTRTEGLTELELEARKIELEQLRDRFRREQDRLDDEHRANLTRQAHADAAELARLKQTLDHEQKMESERLRIQSDENRDRAQNAYELDRQRLSNERFRDSAGQPLEVLLAGTTDSQALTALVNLNSENRNAEVQIAQAEAQVKIAQANADAVTAQAQAAAAATPAPDSSEDTVRMVMDLHEKESEAQREHIRSLQDAADKRSKDQYQMADLLSGRLQPQQPDVNVTNVVPAQPPATTDLTKQQLQQQVADLQRQLALQQEALRQQMDRQNREQQRRGSSPGQSQSGAEQFSVRCIGCGAPQVLTMGLCAQCLGNS